MKYMMKDHGEMSSKVYTLEELREYFETGSERIYNIEDLKDWLEDEADGMAVPYEFIETPWYAVVTDDKDNDFGFGSYDKMEALWMMDDYRNKGYKDAHVIVVDDDDDLVLEILKF